MAGGGELQESTGCESIAYFQLILAGFLSGIR